jgi:hypothetical protein
MSKPLALAVFFSMTALFSEPAAVLAQATTPSPPGEAAQATTPAHPVRRRKRPRTIAAARSAPRPMITAPFSGSWTTFSTTSRCARRPTATGISTAPGSRYPRPKSSSNDIRPGTERTGTFSASFTAGGPIAVAVPVVDPAPPVSEASPGGGWRRPAIATTPDVATTARSDATDRGGPAAAGHRR